MKNDQYDGGKVTKAFCFGVYMALCLVVPTTARAAVGVDLNGSMTIWWNVVDSGGYCVGSVSSLVGDPPFSQWNGQQFPSRGSRTIGPFPNPGTYTFSCRGVNDGSVGSDTIIVCGAGTTWNGTSCASVGGSTITATNNPCTIGSGQNSCTPAPQISWNAVSAANPVVEVVGSISGSAIFDSGNPSGSKPASLITDYETFTFNLRDGASGPILASVVVDGQCASGTSWSGGSGGLCQPTVPSSCSATTMSNCVLPVTSSGLSAGSCASGFAGSCSYTCNNGTWGAPSSNSCTSCTIVNSSGCGTYGCALLGGSCDCGAYNGWEVVGGVWQTCSMPPPNPFTLSGTSPINYNTSAELSWSASPATNCNLYRDGILFRTVPTSATNYSTNVLSTDTSFRVDCANVPSSVTSSNTLTIRVRPQITVTGPSPATVKQTAGPWASMDVAVTTNATQCWWSRSGTGDPLGNWTDQPVTLPQSWTNLGNGWNPGTYVYSFRCQSSPGVETTSGPHTLTVLPPASAAGVSPSTGFVDIGNFLVGVPGTVIDAFRVVNNGDPGSTLTVTSILPSSGSTIVCTTCGPSAGIVAPGGFYSVNLGVNIPTPGPQDIPFTINTDAGVVAMLVHADAEYPFDPATIDFGRIVAGSFGSTTVKTLNLLNKSSLVVPGGTFTFVGENPSHAPLYPLDHVFMCWNSTTASWATSCPYQDILPGGVIRDMDGNPFRIRFAPLRPEHFEIRGAISTYPSVSITLDGWGATGRIRYFER